MTTATQSVAEYFKAKLAARALGRSTGVAAATSSSSVLLGSPLAREIVAEAAVEVPDVLDAGSRSKVVDDAGDAVDEPHAGLGSRLDVYSGLGGAGREGGGGGGLDMMKERVASVCEAVPTGLGPKFGGLMGGVSVVVPVSSPPQEKKKKKKVEKGRLSAEAAEVAEDSVTTCNVRDGDSASADAEATMVKKKKKKKDKKEKKGKKKESDGDGEEGRGKKRKDEMEEEAVVTDEKEDVKEKKAKKEKKKRAQDSES